MPKKPTKKPAKKLVKKDKGGRPLFDRKDESTVVQNLLHVFRIGGTVDEACAHAGISRSAFYEYVKKNPQFLDEKERARLFPQIEARHLVVQSIVTGKSVESAKWYLERKAKEEFSTRQEKTGADGGPIKHEVTEKKEKIDQALNDL